MSEAIVYRVPVNHMQPAELRPSETGYDVVMIEHYQALRDEVARLRANLINCSERLAAYYGDNYPAVVDARAALTPAGGGQK